MSIFGASGSTHGKTLRDLRDATRASRDAASDTLSAIGSSLSRMGNAGGPLAQQIAAARTIFGLVRRYPVPALCVAGVAVAFLLTYSRHAVSHHRHGH